MPKPGIHRTHNLQVRRISFQPLPHCRRNLLQLRFSFLVVFAVTTAVAMPDVTLLTLTSGYLFGREKTKEFTP